MNSIPAKTAEMLEAIRAKHPLVHNITNYVVMHFTANVLLSMGASPVMAHAGNEVEEMVSIADALVINIGTLSDSWIESMFLAGRTARRRGIPVVLDPVGAGATRLRTETARQLIREVQPRVIRANASELLAVTGVEARTKGVDSSAGLAEARLVAGKFALDASTIVAITGAEDFITDGKRCAAVANGHPLMGRITGTGCAATAITAAFCAVETDAFLAAVGALTFFAIAGERAAATQPRPGSFQNLLLDSLDEVDRRCILEKARVSAGEV